MSEMRRHSHREGSSRSPGPGVGVGPVAVKVEESSVNKPLPDAHSVDREKVKQFWWRALFGVYFFAADLSHALTSILQRRQTSQGRGVFKKLGSF